MSESEDTIRIIKTATTKTLSGKSTLSYQLGTEDDDVYVRITKNTGGGGFFSDEWISMEDIQAVMEEHPKDTPVTSFILFPLFKGRSVNTPAFLLAALANEKLLYPMTGKKRSLEPAGDFTEKVTKLLASKGTARSAPKKTSSSTKKKTVTRKAAIKKKAMARKKTS